MNFDTNKYRLGKLCPGKHEFAGTGYSLRYVKGGHCTVCTQKYLQDYRQNNKEKVAEQHSKYYKENQAERLEYSKEHYKRNKELHLIRHSEYRLNNKEKVRDYGISYNRKNREKIAERRRDARKLYRTSPKGRLLSRKYSQKRRALKQKTHYAAFTLEELQSHFDNFDNRCAYCNDPTILTIDHLIPISQSGPHCLGNIVPACRPCNTSKLNRDPKDWYERQSFYSKKRWEDILKLLGKNETGYLQLPLF